MHLGLFEKAVLGFFWRAGGRHEQLAAPTRRGCATWERLFPPCTACAKGASAPPTRQLRPLSPPGQGTTTHDVTVVDRQGTATGKTGGACTLPHLSRHRKVVSSEDKFQELHLQGWADCIPQAVMCIQRCSKYFQGTSEII